MVPKGVGVTPGPIGIKPRFLWLGKRRSDLYEAIARYRAARYAVPIEWLEELIELEREILKQDGLGELTPAALHAAENPKL
jgi:hypothetical protein